MITRLRCVLAAALLAGSAAAHADTRLWYDAELNPVDDPAAASYRVRVEDQRDGIGWPAELRRIEDDALRMRGYVARPEPGDTDVTWIGHYELYRMAGEHRLAEVGTTDAQARQQGLVTTFDEHPWNWAAQMDSEIVRRYGGGSRWNAGKDLSFVPLRPERVVEVRYDHMEGERFRHTAQFNRWRPDRDPRSCTYEQLDHPVTFRLDDIVPGLGASDAPSL